MSIFLDDHPDEQRLVGRILTRYANLEYLLAATLGEVLNDRGAAVRSLFRLRGGNVRLQVADALLRPAMDGIGLKDAYDAALGAYRCSTSIRNQYAHANWYDAGKGYGLFFTDLQKAAETATGSLVYSMRHVDVPLLKQQDEYLDYAGDWLHHLSHEYKLRAGRSTSHEWPAPKIREKPPLHNPREEHPLPRTMTDDQPPQAEQMSE